MKNILLLILCIIVGGEVYAQNCPDRFDQIFEINSKEGWGVNSQSKSGKLRPGETYEMRLIMQRGIIYKVKAKALAGKEGFSSDQVNFKVIGEQVKLQEKDPQTGQAHYKKIDVVLYNSKTAKEEDEAIFYSNRSRQLTIKVQLKTEGNADLVKCAAVLVAVKRKPKYGLR